MPFDASVVGTLRAVLRAEIEGHRALLLVLVREQQALQAADHDAVTEAAKAKLRRIGELEVLARARVGLLIESGMAVTPQGIETGSLPEALATPIHDDWASLRAVAAEARQVNIGNGHLINGHQADTHRWHESVA